MKVLVLDQIASVNYKYSFSLANALKDAGAQVEMVIDTEADASYCRCPGDAALQHRPKGHREASKGPQLPERLALCVQKSGAGGL